MLTFSEVSYSRGANTLVEALDLTLFDAEKVGIVGANGCGKSTLFQMILGELACDEGRYEAPSGLRIAHAKQEVLEGDKDAISYVLDGDATLRAAQKALAKAETANDGEAIARAHQLLEAADAYSAEARAARLLTGLGFGQQQMESAVKELSGGWQVRLNLAQALIQPSDVLLLDEPTNHLDLDAVLWLEGFLKAYAGTLLIISHDRDFLDAIVGRILHFENKKVRNYSGNYSQFIRIKSEQEQLQQKQFEKQQAKVKHLQSFIDRFKAKASKAKQAQSRVKALEKMATVENIAVREKFSFDFLEPLKKPDPLLKLDEVMAGYGEHKVLSDVKLSVRCDSRIGLLGRNGAGKSTLLKSLVGKEVVLSGVREANRHLNVGYFAQHQLEQLHGGNSAAQHLWELEPDLPEQAVRNYLGSFAFHGDKVFDPVAGFSGGEKARLVLALILYRKPNLILLDEPTNHLDMEMRDALTMAIQNFSGAVILISHDRFLLEATVDELYLVAGGKVEPFKGDTEDYRQWLKQNRWGKESDKGKESKKEVVVDRKQQRQLEARMRQALAPYKKVLDKLESEMDSLQKRLGEFEQKLADTRLYEEENKAELSSVLDSQRKDKERLDEVELEWFQAQDELEQKQKVLQQEIE
ncbi:ATP-binding cassette domain-containing protein [Pleionea sp. CnH1-48]|uniref:ATP-binding cassette domain-containing protein n=1 Tax=Pleionea sp. CnH1-48 TaxID=2954494 RepID=UPI0020974BD1|nr:ATP-binding cassette domain-containing protein [Pleionea sp. CnH1-48]MCO7227080.1 ATP-binding cassette domain-containing protein [Pleionea sp. CnH1-48]